MTDSLNNPGAHGLSEILYAYSSAGGNNGSAFAGFNANTVFLNLTLGFVMLFVRFLPIIGTMAIAGSLAAKKKIATTAGTLSTTNAMFVFLLIVIVLLGRRAELLPGSGAWARSLSSSALSCKEVSVMASKTKMRLPTKRCSAEPSRIPLSNSIPKHRSGTRSCFWYMYPPS